MPWAALLVVLDGGVVSPPPPAIVESELVYDRAPFRSAHASTIAETRAFAQNMSELGVRVFHGGRFD